MLAGPRGGVAENMTLNFATGKKKGWKNVEGWLEAGRRGVSGSVLS